MHTVDTICRFLEHLAPLDLAESWDNVGLLVGDRAARVTRVMTCLTITPSVVAEAVREEVDLIVAHHPLPFRPLKTISTDTIEGRMLWTLIGEGVSIYSAHTAFDSAREGINQRLAEGLGLSNILPLQVHPSTTAEQPASHSAPGYAKDASAAPRHSNTSPPSSAARGAAVAQGMASAAAAKSSPAPSGQSSTPGADRQALGSHDHALAGTGRSGTPPAESRLETLAERVKKLLGLEHLQIIGSPSTRVQRVAVACGSGGELLSLARAVGCDLFFTGELRFHSCLEIENLGMTAIIAGHYATERMALEQLAERLAGEFGSLAVWASHHESDPIRFC